MHPVLQPNTWPSVASHPHVFTSQTSSVQPVACAHFGRTLAGNPASHLIHRHGSTDIVTSPRHSALCHHILFQINALEFGTRARWRKGGCLVLCFGRAIESHCICMIRAPSVAGCSCHFRGLLAWPGRPSVYVLFTPGIWACPGFHVHLQVSLGPPALQASSCNPEVR